MECNAPHMLTHSFPYRWKYTMLNAPWFPHSDFVACKLQQIRFVFTQLAREFQSCKGRHWRHWPIYWRAKAHNKRNAYNFRKNAESIIEFIALCAQLYYEGNDNEKNSTRKGLLHFALSSIKWCIDITNGENQWTIEILSALSAI